MEWNREGITESNCPGEQEPDITGEERQRDIGACGAGDHQTPEAGYEKGEPGGLPPLPRRDPSQPAAEHDGQGQIGRIEEVLVMPAKDKLAADGEEGRQCGDREIIGTQEEAQ